MEATKGFSLIELIMVIVLISIMSVYAVFNWPGTIVNLEGQAEQVADDLRFAQALSMTQGQRYEFVILSSTTYQIQAKSTSTPIILAQGNTTVTLNSGITFGSYSTSTISFDGKGNPYDSSNTLLAANATIPLTANAQTKTVVITPVTGRVTVQ